MRTCITVMVMVALLVMLAGCTGQFPLKWRPSEPQKQAADLVVQGTHVLEDQVPAWLRPLVQRMRQAAKITQRYLGLPAHPLEVGSPANEAILEQAAVDAARPPPTAAEIAAAVANEIERGTEAGFSVADAALTSVLSILGAVGATGAVRRVAGWRKGLGEAQTQLSETTLAAKQIIAGIEELPAEAKAAVKELQSKHQTPQTEAFVTRIRKGGLVAQV